MNGFKFPRNNYRNYSFAVITAMAYYFSAKFGLLLSFKPDYIAALWPPNAVLLSALLLTKRSNWILFLLAIIPAELAADLPAGISLKMSLGFVISDWIEVLTAAVLFRKFSAEILKFDTLKQLFSYIFCCAIIAPFIAAFAGSLAAGIDADSVSYLNRWFRWFAGDTLTHLIVTPFIVLWMQYASKKIKFRSVRFYVEVGLLSMSVIIVVLIAFCGIIQSMEIFSTFSIYLPLPVLLWAAVRFGPKGIYSSALVVAIAAIWSASNGSGPFVMSSVSKNVIHLQLHLLLTLTPLLFLATLIENQKKTKSKLEKSEILLKETQRISKMGGWEYDIQSNVSTFTESVFEIYGETFSSPEQGIKFYYPDDRPLVMKSFETAISKGEPYDIVVRFINAQGDHLYVRTIGKPVMEKGRVVRILGNLIDVTEQKRHERQLKVKTEKLELALKEIKTLSGLLPICARCKKIRDDKGYWNSLESYIEKHTEASFSHGMCQECSDELYGKEDWYISMKNDKSKK